METSAVHRFARLSPQKARLVADQIRGMPVERAVELLVFSNKNAAVVIKKVLESAIANAEHNEGADIDELKVHTVCVDEGPTYKRWRARARGRVNEYLAHRMTILYDQTVTCAHTHDGRSHQRRALAGLPGAFQSPEGSNTSCQSCDCE